MKSYATFSDWKQDQSARNQRMIAALATLIEAVDDTLDRTVKWGQGCWEKNGTPKLYIHAEPDHVQLGFYRGSTMKDPARILEGRGKYVRFVRIRGATDIRVDVLTDLIRQVI